MITSADLDDILLFSYTFRILFVYFSYFFRILIIVPNDQFDLKVKPIFWSDYLEYSITFCFSSHYSMVSRWYDIYCVDNKLTGDHADTTRSNTKWILQTVLVQVYGGRSLLYSTVLYILLSVYVYVLESLIPTSAGDWIFCSRDSLWCAQNSLHENFNHSFPSFLRISVSYGSFRFTGISPSPWVLSMRSWNWKKYGYNPTSS